MRHLRVAVMVIVAFLIGLIALLFINTQQTEKALNENISQVYLDHIKEMSTNVQTLFLRYIQKDLYSELKHNLKLRNYLQDALSLLAIEPFKYVYVLYRDESGKYRYLVDGSKEDRGEFGQKLDVDKKEWDKVYEQKRELIFKHKDMEFLYITYLKPLIIDKRVQGVIAVDLTTDFPQQIQSLLQPLKKIFTLIFLSFFTLFVILAYQFYLYLIAKKSSLTDSLTKAYNRTYLRSFLEEIEPKEYAVLMLDIDHFKNINDTYGHKAGDFILQEVSNTIRTVLREEDRFIRYGGEEFLIFIKNPQHPADVLKIAERIRKSIEEKVVLYEQHKISITISIGVVLHPERYKNIKDAIKKADELLYKAKKEGRNKVVIDEGESKQGLEIDLGVVKEALEEGRVFCDYQPIVEIKSGKIAKYEALVRMRDREDKVIYPGMFLDKIAYTTIYNSLTKRVLEVVFSDIKRYQVSISVNLNFSDILDNVIFAIIKKEIEKHIDIASYLTIELLENEPLEHIETIRVKLEELKSLGVRIAVDDFGSGYSNFAIFKSLPIDILKIDGSLIKEVVHSKVSYSIVKSIGAFTKEIGVKSVGEFVENEEILDMLTQLGIDYAQGFYLAKPGPINGKKS